MSPIFSQAVFFLFPLFPSHTFPTTLSYSQPLKCQGSRVKHMQHGLQFITQHLPDNFSLLTSLGKSHCLLYNVWGLSSLDESVAIGWYPSGVWGPTRPIRLVCTRTRLESATETGRGPRIYRNHMQMDGATSCRWSRRVTGECMYVQEKVNFLVPFSSSRV